MKRRFVPLVGLLLAVLLVIGSAGTATGGGADGAYSRFNTSTVKGMVYLDYDGPTTVSVGLVGLLASAEYFVVGRSIGCNGTPSTANRAFRIEGSSDGDADLFVKASPAINKVVRSIWVGRVGQPGSTVCSVSFNFAQLAFAAGGDADGDGAYGGSDASMILVEKRPDGRARVSVVFDDTDGKESVSVRGVNKGCGKRPTNSFFDVFVGDLAFKTKTVDMTQNELNNLRSARYRESDFAFGCTPLSIIAVLIGM